MTVFERHADEHPVLAFRRWVEEIPDQLYPAELVPVGERYIPGVVAFPGSFGLYIEPGEDGATPPPFPHGGVMFVGNTLDGEQNYLERYSRGQPHGDPASDTQRMAFWKVLYDKLLDPAGVPLDQFFVTNVHPALLRGESAQGSVSRKPANRSWWEHCQDLLMAQLQEMRPAVLVTLGGSARTALNRLLDTKLPAGGPEIISTELAGVSFQAVPLAHPSAWAGLKTRQFGDATGRAADAAALAEAWRRSGRGNDLPADGQGAEVELELERHSVLQEAKSRLIQRVTDDLHSLDNTTRGMFAEELVASALPGASTRANWAGYDIEWHDVRIEVKTSGAVQSWHQTGQAPSRAAWSVPERQAWDPETNEYADAAARSADVYVLARHEGEQITEGWTFYVVPTSMLNDLGQTSLGIGTLDRLAVVPVTLDRLEAAVSEAVTR